jgi:transcription-repair coupling factor (superfamily II helicase)
VNEAVAELKGEPVRAPAEVKIELPVDAHLPADYVEREDARLEAYRRLAAVATGDEVADIRAEWLDRYGPVPPPAEALLAVARLRVECLRTGVREVTVVKGSGAGFGGPRYVARLAPLSLRTSKVLRLEREYKDAVYKETAQQLQFPVRAAQEAAEILTAALRELVPVET